MNSKHFVPIILLGSAGGAVKRGEDGLAIGIIVAVVALHIVMWVLDEIDESRERKRRAQR